MKITVCQTPKTPYAKLNIEDTIAAADTLTGGTFKTWALLAINQDGFVWTGELGDAAKNELAEHGYLSPSGDGFVFHVSGGGESAIPEAWKNIVGLYPGWTMRDVRNVLSRLNDIFAADRVNEVLNYWKEQYTNLQSVDHSNARNLLLYDFSIVLNWWLHKSFKFEPGDIVIAGRNAGNLRIKSELVKENICKSMIKNHADSFPIHDGNMGFWNGYFSRGLIDLKTSAICEIIQKRGHL